MAEVMTRYAHTLQRCCDGTIHWENDSINLALVSSSYLPSTNHTLWSQVSSYEVTSGNGYTTGGVALTNKSITSLGLFANDVFWESLTKTFRYGILYKLGTANGLTNPLFAYILFNSNNQDKVVAGIDFAVLWSATGVMSFQ